MNDDKFFLGRNGFIWFNGVVEDRQDPQYLGRVRVRCIGFHTADKIELPTADLPWAMVALPITSPGISGLGSSPSFLVEGSWVYGYFRDGQTCQEPIVLGSLPGRPLTLGNPNKGFFDPHRRSEVVEEDNYNISVYPRNNDEPDTNRLAVNNINKEATSLTERKAARLTNIVGVNNTWSQPAIAYNAVYPYNHVYESESGHIMEFDDSFVVDEEGNRTNHYRVHLRHTSGTSIEMTNNGDSIEIIKNDKYILITNDNKVYIQGDKDVIVNGDYDLKINGNYNIAVAGNKTETITGNNTATVSGSNTETTSGALVIRGATIDLNP
jgi:hypothetical protein